MVKAPATAWGWSKAVGLPLGKSEPMTVAQLKALRAAMPPDDRTEMQKLLGEPQFHRSALAAKRHEGSEA